MLTGSMFIQPGQFIIFWFVK